MVPDKKKPSALASKIPASPALLNRLVKAQSQLDKNAREKLFEGIVVETTRGSETLDSPCSSYIVRRLISGIAASSGFSRENYSAILMRLTKAHLEKSGSTAVDQLLESVSNIYGDSGTFNSSYGRGDVERALGMLVSTAAIVRGAGASNISTSAAKGVVQNLKRVCTGDVRKWNLAPAVISVLQALLKSIASNPEKDSFVKPLWRWAEEQSKYQDGISIALLLLVEYDLVSQSAFMKLYPTFSEFSKALMSSFETGFPVDIYTHPSQRDLNNVSSASKISGIPFAWALAFQYLSSSQGRSHLGGIAKFWESVVCPKLLQSAKSTEKKGLALILFPLALFCAQENEPFESVLDANLAKAVSEASVSINKKKGKTPNLHKKLRKGSGDSVEKISGIAANVQENLASVLMCDKVPTQRRVALAIAVFRWALRHRLYNSILRGNVLVDCVLSTFSEQDLYPVFFGIAEALAKPDCSTKEGIEPARNWCIQSLLKLSHTSAVFAENLMLMLLVYSTGYYKDNSDDHGRMKLSKKNTHQVQTVEKIILTTDPAASPATAHYCFSRLISFMLRDSENLTAYRKIEIAANLQNRIANEKSDFRKLIPMHLRAEAAELTNSSSFLKLSEILEGLSESHCDKQLQSCVSTVGSFLKACIFDPRLSSDDVESTKCMSELQEAFKIVSRCGSSVIEKRRVKDSNDSSTSLDPSPSVLEQTAHMLCTLPSRISLCSTVSVLGMDMLGDIVDDSVTAVVFDMLDEAIKDEGTQGDVESDSDVDNEMEVEEDSTRRDGTGDGARESEGMKLAALDVDDDSDSENGDVENGKDVLDVDIDPDKEDPAILEAFDRHLSNHMKILSNSKKQSKKMASDREERVNSLLGLVETMARRMRLRVEKEQSCDIRTPIVYLDLIIRSLEFVFSNEYDASKYAKRVDTICSRHLSRSKQLIEAVSDQHIVLELSQRFFSVLTTFEGGRRFDLSLSGTVPRISSILVKIMARVHKSGHNLIVKWFQELWTKFLEPRNRHIPRSVFEGFVSHSAEDAARLGETAARLFLDKSSVQRHRRQCVDGLSVLLPGVSKLDIDGPSAAASYWTAIRNMATTCSSNSGKDFWKDSGTVKAFMKILDAGLSSGALPEGATLKEALSQYLVSPKKNRGKKRRRG